MDTLSIIAITMLVILILAIIMVFCAFWKKRALETGLRKKKNQKKNLNKNEENTKIVQIQRKKRNTETGDNP
jgi:FtsZ-interacting cell division protein ZipA